MTAEESVWIGKTLRSFSNNKKECRLLNVGSSTREFRRVRQSHIHENIFRFFEDRFSVIHLDIKEDEGVDLVGDVTNDEFLHELAKEKFDIVLCSNLLEHVEQPEKICQAMEKCVDKEGVILVTVPHLFPYHNDPIDTMFRPDVEELAELFEESKLVSGEILTINNNHFRQMINNKRLLLLTLARWFTPFYKFESWKKIISDIPNTFSNYEATCIVLSKNIQSDLA